MQTMSLQIIKRLHFSTNHHQHAAIAMITHNNLLLMKAIKKEIILKLFVGMPGLKIVPSKAPMPCKNVSIKIEIQQV